MSNDGSIISDFWFGRVEQDENGGSHASDSQTLGARMRYAETLSVAVLIIC